MRCIAYFRVSSKEQEKKESIKSQALALENFLKEQKGYELVEEPFKDDGISAEDIDRRPGFRAVLERIGKGDVDCLLCYMEDRIGRFASRGDRNTVVQALEDSKTSVVIFWPTVMMRPPIVYDSTKEEDLNNLEVELNAARLDNKKRAMRIQMGHTKRRLQGKWSGGPTPYGITWTGERFEEVPVEVATLREIFKRLIEGWGVTKVAQYLNEHPDQFPKRKYRGSHINPKWRSGQILSFVHNSFYHMGVIQKATRQKSKKIVDSTHFPRLDTGIVLFSEDYMNQVRTAAQTKRCRFVDPRVSERKRERIAEVEPDTVGLLRGLVRCGTCGTVMGTQIARHQKKRPYAYYACRAASKKDCSFLSEKKGGRKYAISGKELEAKVWEKFIRDLGDPEAVVRSILSQDFLNGDREGQKASLGVMEQEAQGIESAIEQTTKQHRWGHISDEAYLKERENLNNLLTQKLEEIQKLEAILKIPKEVRGAVEEACKHIAEQVNLIAELVKLEKTPDLPEDPQPEDPDELPEWLKHRQKLIKKMIGKSIELKKVLTKQYPNKSIQQLIFAQKRALLLRYIDFRPGKGIILHDIGHVEIFYKAEPLNRFNR